MSSADEPEFRQTARLLGVVAEANWGRWGDDDELGAINYLGGAEMRAGMAAAYRDGDTSVERYTLQTPMTGHAIDALVGDAEFPTTDTGDPHFPTMRPARRDNVADADVNPGGVPSGGVFAEDQIITPLHLHGTTHFDALAHGWYDGKLYNGFDPGTTRTSRRYEQAVEGCDGEAISETFGLGRADISNAAASGVAGRGVLLDVGRYAEDVHPYRLPMGRSITLEDLLATADAQGVTIEKRDVLLIRTGALEAARDSTAEWTAMNNPGLTYSDDLVRWVRDMEIPIIGADNLGVEEFMHEVSEVDLDPDRTHLAGRYLIPLHGAFLRDLGVTIHEVVDLAALAEQAADDGIYDFLYTAAPLHVEMGTAAPVNPVVLKSTGGRVEGD